MLPAVKYTEYTSPSGNTQIYVFRRKPQKSFIQKFFTSRKYAMARQKLLGIVLIIIGIIGMVLFTDEATAPCVLVFMGVLRVACK